MRIIGTLLGGLFGFMLLGPLGLFLGIFIGRMFDRGISHSTWSFLHNGQSSVTQKLFFDVTFSVMGHVAKSDGRISESEISAARATMQRFGLNETECVRAINCFNVGKQQDFDLVTTLKQFLNQCRQMALRQLFIEIQIQAAIAGGLTSQKKQLLKQLIQLCDVPVFNLLHFADLFSEEYKSHAKSAWQNRSNTSDDYATLGVSSNATPAEIKRAYRKLMSENHPDKLMSKGLPESMVKAATEKTQRIRTAYEKICKARGI